MSKEKSTVELFCIYGGLVVFVIIVITIIVNVQENLQTHEVAEAREYQKQEHKRKNPDHYILTLYENGEVFRVFENAYFYTDARDAHIINDAFFAAGNCTVSPGGRYSDDIYINFGNGNSLVFAGTVEYERVKAE